MATPSPRRAPDVVEPGVPATEETPEEQLATGDTAGGGVAPKDRPQGVTAWGTTAREQREGEPLDVRVRHEVPETREAPEGETTRQLLEPGAESGIDDETADLVGEEDARAEDTLSAEEAAMHLVDEPGGANDDDDPGYIQRG
jgi:hypothetical protein